LRDLPLPARGGHRRGSRTDARRFCLQSAVFVFACSRERGNATASPTLAIGPSEPHEPEETPFSPAFHATGQKLRVHGFDCTLALLAVQLIEREAGARGRPALSPCAAVPRSAR
jgi:hypothetical protein